MSFDVHDGTNAALTETRGARIWRLHGGDGRLDVVTTEFWTPTTAADAYEATYFKSAWTPHPEMPGMVLRPESTERDDRITGVTKFTAEYIGSKFYPALPKPFIESLDKPSGDSFTSLGRRQLVGDPAGGAVVANRLVIVNTSEGGELSLLGTVADIVHVHFDPNERPPYPGTGGALYLFEDLTIDGAANVLQIPWRHKRRQIMLHAGRYSIVRDSFEMFSPVNLTSTTGITVLTPDQPPAQLLLGGEYSITRSFLTAIREGQYAQIDTEEAD